ncbi:Anosmin-1 [Liparis tanakae]|uniref:Anosmin-1 n=1 Tax=Liparis tanakae TaxID=230148 RepID=A0A4Z2GBU2_9TELE|nr:Anosmin-1 [Liparis tanakae]
MGADAHQLDLLFSKCCEEVAVWFVAERPLAGRKVVLRPERLSAEFRLLNGSVLMNLRWRISHHAPGLAAVEGFRFTWTLQPTGGRGGPEDTPPSHEDTLPSQTQSIGPSRRSVAVSGLQADRVYQLQLQLLPAGGVSGAAVSKTVRTPRFELFFTQLFFTQLFFTSPSTSKINIKDQRSTSKINIKDQRSTSKISFCTKNNQQIHIKSFYQNLQTSQGFSSGPVNEPDGAGRSEEVRGQRSEEAAAPPCGLYYWQKILNLHRSE